MLYPVIVTVNFSTAKTAGVCSMIERSMGTTVMSKFFLRRSRSCMSSLAHATLCTFFRALFWPAGVSEAMTSATVVVSTQLSPVGVALRTLKIKKCALEYVEIIFKRN